MPKDTASRNRFSLKFSLGSAFIGIAVLTALLLGLANYWNIRTYARNDIREKMQSTVAVAALLISAELHDSLKSPEDEATASYKTIKKQLIDIRDRFSEVKYVYTFRKNAEGKIEFVVDAEEDPEELSHVGDTYEDSTPTLEAAFREPYSVQVESEFATDKWGTWLSAFAPIVRADGSLAGVIGMDMSAEKILAYERNFLIVVLSISLSVCLLVAVLGLFFARSLSRPLIALAGDMSKIQSLDLGASTKFDSKIQEVLNMGTALENMKMGLRSFRKYVPAELVTELIGMEKEALLGVEKRHLTIFFSDIADFTTISEAIGVEKLSLQLGEYFEVMTKTVLAKRGSVDKFIGDAVMAFWGAPSLLKDHAVQGCLAALECQSNLEALFAKWQKAGLPLMPTRIGLNSGEVVVGNVGYPDRLSYTALGDNVNLAARLEALNKVYGTKIIISESTFLLAKHVIEARPIDAVVVKGKTTGVVVYELLGERGTLTQRQMVAMNSFKEGFLHYQARNWQGAHKIFSELVAATPTDKPAQILRDRCAKYSAEPPPADWTGAIYLRDK